MFPELQTSRLILTRIESADAHSIFEMFADPKVVEYYDLEPFTTLDEAEQLIGLFESRFNAASGIRWAIRERGSEKLIGTCGFNSWSNRMRHGTVGFDLRQSHWGRGIATEAVSEIISTGVSGALPCGKLHRLQADTIVGNSASERVLTKLGFREEGIRRDAAYVHGAYRDMKSFGLILEESSSPSMDRCNVSAQFIRGRLKP